MLAPNTLNEKVLSYIANNARDGDIQLSSSNLESETYQNSDCPPYLAILRADQFIFDESNNRMRCDNNESNVITNQFYTDYHANCDDLCIYESSIHKKSCYVFEHSEQIPLTKGEANDELDDIACDLKIKKKPICWPLAAKGGVIAVGL
jgi:hypothetical protein